MKAVRYFILLPIFILLSLSYAGCGNTQDEESEYSAYYLNKEDTKIVSRPYEVKAKKNDTTAMVEEFLILLSADSGDVEYKKIIPSGVEVNSYVLEGNVLSLYFDSDYSTMDRVSEVLVRAAVVRTMTQIKGVECLNFYVGDSPLTDIRGSLVGIMTNDSFIENPGEQINTIQTSTITLYFANEEGNGLVQETQEVHYSSNISMEKLVIEHLLAGPKSKKAQSAIPTGTKLVSVSVLDGVCYVNLGESFMNQNYSIEEPVVIYSIVNSLSEISMINKVQISVNGNTKGVYRDSYQLDEMYERNLDYVTKIIKEEIEVNDIDGTKEEEADTSE